MPYDVHLMNGRAVLSTARSRTTDTAGWRASAGFADERGVRQMTAQAGRPPAAGSIPGADICTIERELRRLHARARSASVELARSVHPHLDPALYALLVDVTEAGELRAVDLAEARGVTKSAVSRQVRALERLGLLRRASDPSDARAQTLVVTPDGRRAVRRWQAARRRYTQQLLSSCSAEQLAQIAASLARLNELME